MKFIILNRLSLIFFIVVGLINANAKNYKNKVKKSFCNNHVKSIDLDFCKPVRIKNYVSIEHRTLDKIGQKNTIVVLPELVSSITADKFVKAKNDYDGDKVYSNFKLYWQEKLLINKDNILGISAYDFDSSKKNVSFLIIKDQNTDTYITTSDLYIVNLKTQKVICLKTNLTNSANAPFSKDQSIYYLDNLKLYEYNYIKSSGCEILEFTNSTYIVLNIKKISDSTFRVIYMKDIVSGNLFEATFEI